MKIIPLQSNFLSKSARQNMSTQKKKKVFMNYKDFTDSRVFIGRKKKMGNFINSDTNHAISEDLLFLCESFVQK